MLNTPLAPPSVSNIVVTMFVRQAITAASALLIAKGVLNPADGAAFVSLGIGAAGAVGVAVWTTVRAYATKSRWFQAFDATPPRLANFVEYPVAAGGGTGGVNSGRGSAGGGGNNANSVGVGGGN